MFSFNKILVPTDFSECFEIALKYSLEFAKSLEAELHIVHVIQPAILPADLGYPQVSTVDIEKEIEANAHRRLDNIKGTLRNEGVNFEAKILFGKPSDQIIDYSRKENIDLICISTHGRSGFQHLLFGSTTEKVLRKAVCPVLSVRMPDK